MDKNLPRQKRKKKSPGRVRNMPKKLEAERRQYVKNSSARLWNLEFCLRF